MKTTITILLLFITTVIFSQSVINYKAIIKDGSGNILASQSVDVQFIIYQGVALTNNVYEETHTTATDANGLVILNIGAGTTSDVFGDIDWASDQHFLNVHLDTGGGLTDLGTTAFQKVPYAIHAENVTGLEATNEGNGVGHRIIGRNLNNLGDIGENAVDVSVSPIASTTYGATGDYSFAANRQTTAQGDNATAFGLDSKAYGNTSTVMGFNAVANGYDAVAMGAYTVADAVQSVALGRYNIGGGHNQIWNPVEPVFEIGNGTNNANRSNALTVLKNGTITAPSITNALIETAGNKSLISKEYLETRITGFSLNDLSDAKTVNDFDVFIGHLAGLQNTGGTLNTGVGYSALRNAVSGNNTAIGYYSLSNNTNGSNNTAVGSNALASTSSGGANVAVGRSALFDNEMGTQNTAVGFEALYSNIDSDWNTAVGSFALYENTGSNNTAVGRAALANCTSGNSNVAVGWNSLNTLTTGNSNIGIGTGAQVPNPAGNNQLRIGGTSINYAGVQVAWTITSDERWKDQIRDLPYGLDMVSELRPVDYIRKNNEAETREAGFIAQEVQLLLKDLGYNDQGMLTEDDDGYLSLRYNDFIPVLVKAIQEQQDIINLQKAELASQGSKIEILSEENASQNSKMQLLSVENQNQNSEIKKLSEEINEIQQLVQRINRIETNLNLAIDAKSE